MDDIEFPVMEEIPSNLDSLNETWMRPDDVKILLTKINRKMTLYMLPAIMFILVVMVVGIAGNSLTVFIYGWRWQSCTTRIFLLWLAVFDIFSCVVSLPTEIHIITNFYNFPEKYICALSRFVSYLVNNSSSIILIAIAIDRYIRICHPSRKYISIFAAKMTCGLSIIISLVMSWPALFLYGRRPILLRFTKMNTSITGHICEMNISRNVLFLEFCIMLWLGYTICSILLVVLYSQIGQVMLIRLRKKSRRSTSVNREQIAIHFLTTEYIYQTNQTLSTEEEHPKIETSIISSSAYSYVDGNRPTVYKHQRTTLTFFAVTAVFVISFLPYLIIITLRMIRGPGFHLSMNQTEKVVVNLISRSYIISSCANPVLYSLVNSRFREKVKQLLKSTFTNGKQIVVKDYQ